MGDKSASDDWPQLSGLTRGPTRSGAWPAREENGQFYTDSLSS
jgi:hypothetical protein